jgi:hypothetical protein
MDDPIQEAETIITRMRSKVVEFDKARAAIAGDKRLKPEAMAEDLAKLNQQYRPDLESSKSQAVTLLEQVEQTTAREIRVLSSGEVLQPEKDDVASWSIAAARREFVREEVEANPQSAAEKFRESMQKGDRVGAWLIARYARPLLEASANPVDLMKFNQAISELVEPKKRNALQEKMARANAARMSIPKTEDDIRRFADAYGVRFEAVREVVRNQ